MFVTFLANLARVGRGRLFISSSSTEVEPRNLSLWCQRAGQWHRICSLVSSSSPQNLQLVSSMLLKMLLRKALKGPWPVRTATTALTVLLLVPIRCRPYPFEGFLINFLDILIPGASSQAFLKSRLVLSFRVLSTVAKLSGRTGSGAVGQASEPARASLSASSLPSTPEWPGTHARVIGYLRVLISSPYTFLHS